MENGEKTEKPSLAEMGKPYRFTSENQPANRGRKPSLYHMAAEDYDVSYEDFCKVCKYLMQRTKTQLEDIVSSEDTPMWVINVARAIHKDSGKGVTFTIQWLANRFWGNPQDSLKMDASSRVTTVNVSVPDEETAELVRKISTREK